MAISKGTAQAAVNTLKKLSGSALASAMSANKHLFEKHLAKEKAAAAATDTGHAQGYIKQYYEAEKPLELIAQGSGVYPDRIEVAPLSDTSYRARWVERLVKGGEVLTETQWEATVQVALTPPAELNRDQRQRNPLGVWISSVTWFKV